ELAILAARVSTGRQGAEQSVVKSAACVESRQLAQVDCAKSGFHARIDHLTRKHGSVSAPEREHRRDAGAGKLTLAIFPHVLQKQIAEDHVCDTRRPRGLHRCRHLSFVDLVGTWKGDAHHDWTQAGSLDLHPYKLVSHAVHADAVEGLCRRDQGTHDIEIAGAANFIKGPGAVLATRPGNERLVCPRRYWRSAHRR